MTEAFLVIAGTLFIFYSAVIYVNLNFLVRAIGEAASPMRYGKFLFWILPLIGSILMYLGLT